MTREEVESMTPDEAVVLFLKWAEGDRHAWDDVPLITHIIPIKEVLQLQDGDFISYMDGSVEFIPRY